MPKLNAWFLHRIASLSIGVFAFSQAVHVETNFSPLAGLLCGAFVFLFVFSVVNKNSVKCEKIFLPTSPCWPAAEYPQAYWFTTGVMVVVSTVVNLIFHLYNPVATRLYISLLLWGLGIFGGALAGYYQVKRKNGKFNN
jgi:hypothetical protein